MKKSWGTDPYDWAKKNMGIRWDFTDNQKRLILAILSKVWRTTV
jgi:hypothetical protein